MVPDNVKNIIFDLGGVIIDIEPQLTFAAFERLTGKKLDVSLSALDNYPLFSKYEQGLISSDDFLKQILEECMPGTTELDVLYAWNAILQDIDPDKRDLIIDLKSAYTTYLLSNTNEIHREWIDDYIVAHFGDNGLSSWFDKVYTSYELQMQKPSKEIFEVVLNNHDLNPSETLFIDDTPKHLKAAAAMGIQTIQATEDYTLLDIFEYAH